MFILCPVLQPNSKCEYIIRVSYMEIYNEVRRYWAMYVDKQ